MRIATWNVNSLMARLPRVEEWIGYAQPDVLCMQETKIADGGFPALALSALGYDVAFHGDGRWNGVAIASRIGLSDIRKGFDSVADNQGCRLISATCGGVRIHSVYVPNGRSVDSEHYAAKLKWLEELRQLVDRCYLASDDIVVAGDFNVAPDDRDVWDPAAASEGTHVTEPERNALKAMEQWGLIDGFRLHYQQDKLFSWWDYRAGHFHKHVGMRIDLLLLSQSLAERCRYALIDRNARKGQQPSDHAPVFVDIDD
ncbi:MAG TPA: exodeoxyribonuclease III [Acidimicrobiales bacterium]|nr:exodeoxyribonuclease III [Acidimicrobiales bacterium]